MIGFKPVFVILAGLINVATGLAAPISLSPNNPPALKARVVRMKELLKGVPEDDRHGFINHLMLKDGQIVSANFSTLMRTLDEDRIRQIKDALAPPHGNERISEIRLNATAPRYVRLSELLAEVPAAAKARFLDSLTFKTGILVSAYTGDLQKALNPDNLNAILSSLSPTVGSDKNAASALCGLGWCGDSACKLHRGKFGCLERKKWTCWSDCSD